MTTVGIQGLTCLVTYLLTYLLTYSHGVAGPLAVIFACWSRHTAAMDWEGAHQKGRVAFCLSSTGLSITAVIVLILVLLLYTKDT